MKLHFEPRRAPVPRLVLLGFVLLVPACTDRGEPPNGPGGGREALPPFRAAATCGACHPTHFAEWAMSMHAFAGSDPLMLGMAELAAQEQPDGVASRSCRECHAPALVRQELWLARNPGLATDVEDLSEDGISCDVCHSISIVPPIGSIEFLHDVDPRGPKLAGLREPTPNPAHESRHDNSFTTSIQCAACHQVSLKSGTGIENTFGEWERSLYSGQGIECQTCHMPAYTGQAATEGPTRDDVHRHFFVGVDYAYGPFRGIDLELQKDLIRDLLENSVSVEVTGVPASVAGGATLDFSVRVRNDRTGHSIPSGVAFAREMWIAAKLLDGKGLVVAESGALDANGDIVEDARLVKFAAVLKDANGDPTFFTWRAASIDESGLIPANESRTAAYSFDIPAGTVGPLTLDLSLRFRPVSHAQVREAGVEEILPIEIFDMWKSAWSIDIAALAH